MIIDVYFWLLDLQHFQANQFKAPLLKPLNDPSNKTTLNSIWLHNYKSPLPFTCKACWDTKNKCKTVPVLAAYREKYKCLTEVVHAEDTHVRAFVYFVSCSCAQSNWNTIWEQMNECVRSIRLHTHVIDTQGNSVYCHYILRMNVQKKNKKKWDFPSVLCPCRTARTGFGQFTLSQISVSVTHAHHRQYLLSNLVPVHDPMCLSNTYFRKTNVFIWSKLAGRTNPIEWQLRITRKLSDKKEIHVVITHLKQIF